MFRISNKLFVSFGRQVPMGYRTKIAETLQTTMFESDMGNCLSWKYVDRNKNVDTFFISETEFKSAEFNKINVALKTKKIIYKSIWDLKSDTEPYHNDFEKKMDINIEIISSIKYKFDE